MAAPAAFYPARGLSQDDRPRQLIAVDPGWPLKRQSLANVYNRVGGLIERLANEQGVSVPAVLAVWFVESSGRDHTPGRAVIRFENHVLFDLWGRDNAALYDQHFRHGGRAPQFGPGCDASWRCHEYRRGPTEGFDECHCDQAQEYDVLDVATSVAGAEIARRCISMGGPQIMGFNHARIGYTSASEMYEAFQGAEGTHVRGFFAFAGGGGIAALRRFDWRTFALGYNGSGQADLYAGLIQEAFAEAEALF